MAFFTPWPPRKTVLIMSFLQITIFNNPVVIVYFLREIVKFDDSTCGSHDKVPFSWGKTISNNSSWISSRPAVPDPPSFFWADDLIYFFEFFHEEFRAKETYVMRQIIYHKGTCIQGSFISSKLVNEPFSCPSFITRQSPKPLLKNGRNLELLLCRSILSWTCNAVLTLLTIIVFVAVSFFFFVHGLRRS